jgi:hypothetical protein
MQHTHDHVDDIIPAVDAPRSLTAGDIHSGPVDVGSMHFDHSDSGFMALLHGINDYEIGIVAPHALSEPSTAHAQDSVHGAGFAALCSELEAQFVADWKQEQAENAFITARLAMVAHSVRQ